ncbi:TIGR02270 family protein [Hyalangium gracile]|uniref:TIGR02270 family protein n=1 Tax=Hyalangium gracile TaxID=394092 RepID=UPI001CC906DB|nr:TIGR02270 family protein [Hyalangium gracile]
MSVPSKPRPPRAFRRPPIPWELMEVHFEEATFLWSRWEQVLWAPDYVLAEVEQGEERRLLAHLDALVLGGRPVAERLLLPALEGEEVVPVSVAALALLNAEDADWREKVFEWLAEGAEEVGEGIRRAVELCPREDITPALLSALPNGQLDDQIRALAALRFRQADVTPALRAMKLGEDTALRTVAVRAARFASRSMADELIRLGLSEPEPQVLDAALEAGLVVGHRQAWARCRQLVEAGGEVPRIALLALALSGEARELELLVAALEDPSLRDEALWALGFSGRLAAADAAFQALQATGDRLAAESFAAITGLPLAPPFIEEEEKTAEEETFEAEFAAEEAEADNLEDEDDEEGGEAPSSPELLPGPEVLPGKVLPERVERWWAAERKRFEPSGRYLRGQPLSVEVIRAALEAEPLNRRAILAWELAIRSKGSCQVEPRTWTHAQRQQMRAAAGLRSEQLLRPFDRLFAG